MIYNIWDDEIIRTSDPFMLLISQFRWCWRWRLSSLKENPCLPEFLRSIVQSVLKDIWRFYQCSLHKDFWKSTYTVVWIFLFYHLRNQKFWFHSFLINITLTINYPQSYECKKNVPHLQRGVSSRSLQALCAQRRPLWWFLPRLRSLAFNFSNSIRLFFY